MTFFFASLFIVLVFWRPQEWLIPWLFGWQLLDVVVVISLLSLLFDITQGRIRFPRKMPQVYLLAGLWFAAVMSHVANTFFEMMMYTIPEVFKICFFTLLLMSLLDRPSRLRTMALIFVGMCCVMAVHALMQERLGYGFIGQRPLYIPQLGERPAHTRSLFFGIFADPNDLAQILATSIPFTFIIVRRRSFRGFLFGCAVTALLVSAILSTHSRGGMVSLIAVGTVMFAMIFPPRRLPVIAILLLVAALLLCPLSAAFLDKSAHDRVVYWGLANWVFKQNLFFGIGYGMFWQVASARASHNAFISCYTTIGVFGYWFWFVLLQVGIVGAWRTRLAFVRPQTEEQEWLGRFAGLTIAATVGFCVSAYFLSRTFIYPLFFLFALLGALPAIAGHLLPKDHPPLIDVRRDVFVMGTIGVLSSIFYIYFSVLLLNKAFYG